MALQLQELCSSGLCNTNSAAKHTEEALHNAQADKLRLKGSFVAIRQATVI